MKLFFIDKAGFTGVGGALRGREMGFALSRNGHEVVRVAKLDAERLKTEKPDGIVETGTWHQLQIEESSPVVQRAKLCEKLKIPDIWWYGSNGSVWGVRDGDAKRRRENENKIIEYLLQRPFFGVICPYSMEIYREYGVPFEKMRLIPSVFDGDLFTPRSTKEHEHIRERWQYNMRIPKNAWCMGTIGNTPNSKGGNLIIRALHLLQREMPDIHYLILHTPVKSLSRQKATSPEGEEVGMSEWEVLLQTMDIAKRLGVQNRVHFIGMRLPRVGMPAFYRMLDIYCSPSEAENLGQPLVESQLMGLPLVTYKGFSFDFVSCPHSAVQFPPEKTETDDFGLVIPKGNPEDAAGAIREARENSESKEKKELTREWTYEKFHHHNCERMAEAIVEYEELMP